MVEKKFLICECVYVRVRVCMCACVCACVYFNGLNFFGLSGICAWFVGSVISK